MQQQNLPDDIIDVGSNDGSDESTEDSTEEDCSWISWFTSLRGNNFFCVIDEDYIQDDFNLTGLGAMVPYYDYALDMILDAEVPLDNLSEEQQELVESAAESLYGLIHARFILTTRGMAKMQEKYLKADFGRCPRVLCQGQPMLPGSISDIPRSNVVHTFCPQCQELYFPRSAKQANLDGAYFGTTFPHLFLMLYPDCIPTKPTIPYVPRIYGFKINSDSAYYKVRENRSKSAAATTSASAGSNYVAASNGASTNSAGRTAWESSGKKLP